MPNEPDPFSDHIEELEISTHIGVSAKSAQLRSDSPPALRFEPPFAKDLQGGRRPRIDSLLVTMVDNFLIASTLMTICVIRSAS